MSALDPLKALRDVGQSLWLDYLGRDILEDGTLKRLIELGVAGETSNPSIFKKAIEHWERYDEAFKAAAKKTPDPLQIFYALALEDVRAAADLLRPTFDRTGGLDGYVSFQLEPRHANDAAAQVREARRVFELLGRPNVMIKVYGTAAGVEAVEELVAAGVNVNITLLFAVAMYERVGSAYIRGLQRRSREGQSLDSVASVASFFVSRIDTAVDKVLAQDSPLRGRAAAANAKLAYDSFRRIFSGDAWNTLARAGARVQRPLWASTGTKDKSYSDVKYVEELVGADTVNTLPLATLDAFRDHGRVRSDAITDDVGGARDTMVALRSEGIDLDSVTSELVEDGIDAFAADLRSVLDTLTTRLKQVA